MLIDRIRADRLVAMKARDALARDLLGTLVAAASKETKEPDDATVIRAIRAFVKSLDETIGHLAGRDASAQLREKAILEGYLPATMDQAALRAAIDGIVASLPDRTPKRMGEVMAALKAAHGASLDMKLASTLVKTALAGA